MNGCAKIGQWYWSSFLDPTPRVLVLVRSGSSKLCWTATMKIIEGRDDAPKLETSPETQICTEPIPDRLYVFFFFTWLHNSRNQKNIEHVYSSVRSTTVPKEELEGWGLNLDDPEVIQMAETISNLRTAEEKFLKEKSYGYRRHRLRLGLTLPRRLNYSTKFQIPLQKPVWPAIKFHYSRLFLAQLGKPCFGHCARYVQIWNTMLLFTWLWCLSKRSLIAKFRYFSPPYFSVSYLANSFQV